MSKRRAERAEAFVAPIEAAVPTVEEKRTKRKHAEMDGATDVERPKKKSKDKVRFAEHS